MPALHAISIAKAAAQEKGAAIIAITKHARSSLALKSRYHIQTVSRERLFFKDFSFFSSTRLAAMSVIETMYFLLLSEKSDSHSYISAHEQAIAEDKS